jgi:hypothetical protein
MRLLFLLPAVCYLTLSCQEENTVASPPKNDESPPAVEAPEKDPQEKVEITVEQLEEFGRFLMGDDPRTRKNIASAKATMNQLVLGIEYFYEEYQYLPGAAQNPADEDQTLKTVASGGSPLVAGLLGMKAAIDENPKLIAFLKYQMAKEGKDGLLALKDSANLVDPWGNPYQVRLNYDQDKQLSYNSSGVNEILFDRRAITWSLGPDRQSGTPETDKDNIYSWTR